MPRSKQSKGTCAYCGKELSKGGVSKHLATCAERQAVLAKAEAGKAEVETLYHLRVQDQYRSEFWLDLEMRGSKSLTTLDTYLRAIWLECCGHMSEFMMAGGLGSRMASQIGKQRKISEAFQSTEKLNHTYDFGTSSETLIKLVSVREGKPTTTKAIALMARNLMPADECIECGKPATHLCMECLINEEKWGTLCDEHTKTHPHDDYGDPIPLVNSPRLGMCGYTGPAEPPY